MSDIYMMASFRVGDFATWQSVYEEDNKRREQAGLVELNIFQCNEDPNALTLIFEVESIERTKAFLDSQEIRERMKLATIEGDPEICYLKKPI
jgi:hypothetical protein